MLSLSGKIVITKDDKIAFKEFCKSLHPDQKVISVIKRNEHS